MWGFDESEIAAGFRDADIETLEYETRAATTTCPACGGEDISHGGKGDVEDDRMGDALPLYCEGCGANFTRGEAV